MKDLSIDPPFRPVWICRVAGRLHNLNKQAKVTNEAVKCAIQFLDALEIDYGVSDPEIRISPRGFVAFRWKYERQEMVVLVLRPGARGNLRSIVRYTAKDNEIDFVAGQQWRGGYVLVRETLAAMFDIDQRWCTQ